jgi:hypothetical protein
MNITHVYSRRQSRKVVRVLRMLGLRVLGTVVESAALPTTELLLLVRERSGAYSLYLLGGSRILPLITVAEDIPEADASMIVPLTARRMMGKNAVIDFEPSREDLQADLSLLLAP